MAEPPFLLVEALFYSPKLKRSLVALRDEQTKIIPVSFPRRRESMISLLLEPVSYFNAVPLPYF